MQSEKNFTDIQASLEKKTDAWLRKRIYKKRICSWSRGSFDMKPNRSCSSMDYTNVVSSANGSPGQRKLLKREKTHKFEIASATVLFLDVYCSVLLLLTGKWCEPARLPVSAVYTRVCMRHIFRLDPFSGYIKLIMYQIPWVLKSISGFILQD